MKSHELKLMLVAFMIAARDPSVLASSSSAVAIDLSYHPRLPTDVLTKTIHDAIIAANNNNNSMEELLIDISSSEVGNAGIEALMQTFSSSALNEEVSLDLTSRMNRLSPEGASSLFKMLLGSDKENEESKGEDGKDNEENNAVVAEEESCSPSLRSLDLSWNNLHRERPGAKTMQANLRKLVEQSSRCPKVLSLNRCSLGPNACRAIGKGIMNRYKDTTTEQPRVPLALHLGGNQDVGDAGAAALAAAIRGTTTKSDTTPIFSTLDLSACSVGDAGAEALAVALESNPGCIERLILSDNSISNAGATSIAQAIAASADGAKTSVVEWLELDNNAGIGNAGASSLADAVGRGKISALSLRSCAVKADGAKAFGQCLIHLASQSTEETTSVSIDLSGNPLGMLKKRKKESLKKKASSTTASYYLNFIGKKVQSTQTVGASSIVSMRKALRAARTKLRSKLPCPSASILQSQSGSAVTQITLLLPVPAQLLLLAQPLPAPTSSTRGESSWIGMNGKPQSKTCSSIIRINLHQAIEDCLGFLRT